MITVKRDNSEKQAHPFYSKCRKRSREEGTLGYQGQECKLLQPLWKTAWSFLKLKTELPQDPAIPLLGIYLTKIKNSNLMEKAIAPHSSALAWKIPWTEEPGRLQSMGSRESDSTERLHFHFSLSCIGEGNGNPVQYSCLENPRDGGAWWIAVYGVAQSQT